MRLGPFIPGLLMAAVVGGYTVYWNIVREEATKIVEANAAELRVQGYEVSWAEMRTAGYPVRVSITLDKPRLVAPEGAPLRAWSGEAVTIHALPYDLQHVQFSTAGRHAATLSDGQALDLDVVEIRASLSSDTSGVDRISLTSQPITARDARTGRDAFTLQGLSAHAKRDPDDERRYRVYAQATAPAWAGGEDVAPDLATLDSYVDRADVLLAAGALDKAALALWSTAGGQLDIQTAGASWGPASVGMDGALAIDPEGYWRGAVTLQAREPALVFDRLSQAGVMPENTARQVGALASAMADADGTVKGPLSLRDGGVYALGMRVGRAPAAY